MRYAMVALECFLFGYGLLMLIRGKGGFASDEVAAGMPARFAGLLLMLPLAIGISAALVESRPWGFAAPEAELGSAGTVTEMLAILVCGALSILITLNAAAVRSRAR